MSRLIGRGLARWVLALLVAAALAGVAWGLLADPPRLEVRDYGTVLPESSSARAFGVEMLFIALGFTLCGVWGAVLGWRRADRGVLLVPVVIGASALASLLAWRIGVPLGPDDPAGLDAADLAVGQTVPLPLAVESFAAFLTWPIGGLLGLVLATWLHDGPRRDVDGRPGRITNASAPPSSRP